MKPFRLLTLLPTRPQEFCDRVGAIVTSRWEASFGATVEYQAIDLPEALVTLSSSLDSDCAAFLSEPELNQIKLQVEKRKASVIPDAPFAAFHDGDSALARLCYVVTRAVQPERVLETGVCYGVISAFLLQGMQVNNRGQLDSIDLPPLGKNADAYVGSLVPQELRHRWILHRGTSGRLLRPLVSDRGSIDIFIHDSLHTYGNMMNEFRIAWPALRAGGLLISDDVEGNLAFRELSSRSDVACSLVIKQDGKKALSGVVVKR
jgi:predicted O-methyltransferase YrrM